MTGGYERRPVRGYWRRSPDGVVHHVTGYKRWQRVAGRAGSSAAHSGQNEPGPDVAADGFIKPRSAPWVEVRYLVRYVGIDGRKHSTFIPRVVGEAWRERSGGAGVER
jgi:hypothetical protein